MVLLGYNFDTPGITLAGGRSGSQMGPGRYLEKIFLLCLIDSFRDCLKLLNLPEKTVQYNLDLEKFKLIDQGNVRSDLGDSMTENQAFQLLQSALEHYLELKNYTIAIIGGSNNSFNSIAKSFLDQKQADFLVRRAIIKIDSAFDCWKQNPSNGTFKYTQSQFAPQTKLVFFGTQGKRVRQGQIILISQRLLNYQIHWLNQIRKVQVFQHDEPYLTQGGKLFFTMVKNLSKQMDEMYLSIDLSCLNAAFFPGISNPSEQGLNLEQVLEILQIAGSQPRIRIIEISEYNPCIQKPFSGKQLVQFVMQFYSSRYKLI